MPIAADILARPLCGVRERISQAIDRVTANAAGTVDGVAVRGVFRREWQPQSEFGAAVGATRCTLSVDASIVATAWAGDSVQGQQWQERGQQIYLTDSDGAVLTDSCGQPLQASPAGDLVQCQPWHAHGQPIYLADSDGDVLTDSWDHPLQTSPQVSRHAGALVEITHGVGVGTYRVTEAIPADGGRVHLVLEIAR